MAQLGFNVEQKQKDETFTLLWQLNLVTIIYVSFSKQVLHLQYSHLN